MCYRVCVCVPPRATLRVCLYVCLPHTRAGVLVDDRGLELLLAMPQLTHVSCLGFRLDKSHAESPCQWEEVTVAKGPETDELDMWPEGARGVIKVRGRGDCVCVCVCVCVVCVCVCVCVCVLYGSSCVMACMPLGVRLPLCGA